MCLQVCRQRSGSIFTHATQAGRRHTATVFFLSRHLSTASRGSWRGTGICRGPTPSADAQHARLFGPIYRFTTRSRPTCVLQFMSRINSLSVNEWLGFATSIDTKDRTYVRTGQSLPIICRVHVWSIQRRPERKHPLELRDHLMLCRSVAGWRRRPVGRSVVTSPYKLFHELWEISPFIREKITGSNCANLRIVWNFFILYPFKIDIYK